MNFNYQQPFYGDYCSNHIEIGDAYFPGLQYMVEVGRMVAEKYWGCRGTYIAVSGYPFKIDKDPFGTGPLSRLAYCTGWAMNQHWNRYLHTQDEDWLRDNGYPVIRDCALFYTDFLKKGDDGLYHAYPSVQGESQFTGRVEDYTDQPQVLSEARYCLESAVKAAEVLDADDELREQWQEIVDHLAPWIDLDALGLSEEDKRRYWLCTPAVRAPASNGEEKPSHLRRTMDSHQWRCSFNPLPWYWLTDLRCGAFVPERDLEDVKAQIYRWRTPGGHVRAMTASDHGFIGAYAESMGVIAPIQEMMLQSWDGVIRVFSAWHKAMNGRFSTLRAEGAFLVSGEFKDGRVQPITVLSEKGRQCRVQNPWDCSVRVISQDGHAIDHKIENGNVVCFDTQPGQRYEVAPVE